MLLHNDLVKLGCIIRKTSLQYIGFCLAYFIYFIFCISNMASTKMINILAEAAAK